MAALALVALAAAAVLKVGLEASVAVAAASPWCCGRWLLPRHGCCGNCHGPRGLLRGSVQAQEICLWHWRLTLLHRHPLRLLAMDSLPLANQPFMVAHVRSCSCRTPPWPDGLCLTALNTSVNAMQARPMAMCPMRPCNIMQQMASVQCANSMQSQPMASVQCASAVQSQPMPRQCQ